jgi:hypothetical protein
MPAPKIARLLALIGVLGIIAVVALGKLAWTKFMLDAALTCLALGGVIFVAHVFVRLWKDFRCA